MGKHDTARWATRVGCEAANRLPVCFTFVVAAMAAAGQLEASQPAASRPATSQPTARATTGSGVDDIDLLSMEVPMVVTAARHEQKMNTVPHAISVVTAEDIRRSGARTIADALRQVPGVDVADLSYVGSAVSPRGFQGALSRSVLVLVDGRQVFDSLFGGTVWGSWPFQLEDIERIEVIRGPGGVTWGSNAVNGVINIITKDPKDQVGLTATGGGGSRGMQKEHLGAGFADQKLRLRVSGEYEGSDGFLKGGSLLRSLEDGSKTGRMTIHSIYEASPNDKITLSGGSAVVDGGYPPPASAGIGMDKKTGSQASYILGKWDHKIAEDNHIGLTGYVNDFYFCPVNASTDFRYQQLAVQLSHTFAPEEGHTVSWGIDSRTDLVDASNSDPYMLKRDFVSTEIIGLYVQDEWRLAPKWTLNLGARIDYEFYGGFQPSARAALSYELASHSSLYAAVSRAFQMNPVGARFIELPLLNGLAYAEGRESIRPETLIAYEVGYHGRFFDRLNTSVNLYWHDYDDLTTLSPRLGPPGLLQFNYDNRASAATYGVEADAKYALSRQVTLLANYTYQEMNWNGSDPYTDKDFITPPEHKFMIGTRYDPLDDLHLSAHLYYVDAVESPYSTIPLFTRQVPRYFRLDLRGEYEFWKKQASVAVGVRNLLDTNHLEGGSVFLNEAEVPRMVYAELRFVFK